LLLALASVFTVIVYKMARNALLNDLLLFRDMLATRAWWGVALAAVVGAPIAEELVFRGLMYGVLRASPVGAVAGAVITAAAWAGVHAQYTIYGMTAIFLIGLYLAWVREKTGSVLAPMVCHAIYNASVLAVLLLAPVWFLEPG
jgi:membrane protease YdiL (CAAX protease family)